MIMKTPNLTKLKLQILNWLIPMKFDGYAFKDIVDGNNVFYYKDYLGTRWMKNSKFGTFKVRAN